MIGYFKIFEKKMFDSLLEVFDHNADVSPEVVNKGHTNVVLYSIT